MTRLVKKNIIIFEPYEGLRESLKLILEDDYRLLFANSIDEALEYGDRNIDLLILNADEPAGALEMVRTAKNRFPDLNILLITTNLQLEFQEKAIKLGTDIRFHEKPWECAELKEQIDTIIRGYSLEKHTYIVKIKLPPQ